MRKTAIALLALGLVVATTAFAANPVRISQVYGGGGSSSGTYKYDYVELFNSGSTPVNIGGWQLMYGSATGSFASNTFGLAVITAGATIPACGYYLMQCGSAGSGGAELPITPDYVNTGAPNLGGTNGKVALFLSSALTNQNCAYALANAVDVVGYGTANCYEGTAAVGPLSVTTVAIRGNGGMTDNDQNSTDFTVLNLPQTLHNSGSGTNPDCQIVPTIPETWGKIKTLYR